MSPEEARDWLQIELRNGVRLVCIEGLMGAGKSHLLSSLDSFAGCCKIELDQFLPTDAHAGTPWLKHVVNGGAEEAIHNALEQSNVVIVDGVVAWPILVAAASELGSDKVRRIYVKRMSKAGDCVYWFDGEQLKSQQTATNRPEYFSSVDRYHLQEEPWKKSDIVVERLDQS